MAGPKGGPPRKKHRKSRTGCDTCKRRHIRCDETMPQCRNCTKHNCRCDYMDRFAPQEISQSPQRPNLLMTPQIEVELKTWRETGQCPFPGIPTIADDLWARLSMTDLRLLHHIFDLILGLHRRGLQHCTPWGDQMLSILMICVRKCFLMNAVLAFSARNLSWITRDEDTKALAHDYYTTAFRTLQEVIRSPQEEDFDSVLAACALLYWTAPDLQTFSIIRKQIHQIISRLKPHEKHNSEFAMAIQGQRPFRTIRPQTASHVDNFAIDDVSCLDYALLSLREACRVLPSLDQYYREKLERLLNFGQQLLQDLPVPADVAFKRLTQLRDWVLWFSAVTMEGGASDYVALSVLCQYYGVALSIEPIFPEIHSMFSALVAEPMVHIKKVVESQRLSEAVPTSVQIAETLMEAPIHILNEYQKTLLYWLSEYRNFYEPVAQHSNYSHSNDYVVTPTTDTYLTPPLLSPLPNGGAYVQQQNCNYFEPSGQQEPNIAPVLPSQEAGTGHTAGYLETPDQENETNQGYNFPVYPSGQSTLNDSWI